MTMPDLPLTLGAPPLWYAGLSAIAFLLYLRDKHAAICGRWRNRESTLHLISLLGGWPGAMLARRIVRHKSRKTAFLVKDRIMAALNMGVLVAWLVLRG